MILQVLNAHQQQARAQQLQKHAASARLEALELEQHARAEAQNRRAEMAAASRVALQERLDINLYEEALMRLQHDNLLLLLKPPVPDQVRAMSDGTGILISLKTHMQHFVHTAREAFDQAEQDCKRRGRGPNQERFLVLHGRWSGKKAFDLCQNVLSLQDRDTRVAQAAEQSRCCPYPGPRWHSVSSQSKCSRSL